MFKILFSFAVVCLAASIHAGVLVEGFDGTSVNSDRWVSLVPFSDSTVTVSGGSANLVNRGRLLSTSSFRYPIEIIGRFRFTGSIHDQLKIVTRTDGIVTNKYSELDKGICFQINMMGDTGITTDNVKIIHGGFPEESPELATATVSISKNVDYDFRITDDGTNVAFYINDLTTPVLSAVDSSYFGGRIGIYNREGAANGSTISAGSSVSINTVLVSDGEVQRSTQIITRDDPATIQKLRSVNKQLGRALNEREIKRIRRNVIAAQKELSKLIKK